MNQDEAILGEPVIIEIKNINKEYWAGYPIEIEIDGPIYDCIILNENWYIPADRINIVDYLRMSGEYEINIALDELYGCESKPWLQDEKWKEIYGKNTILYKKFKEREEKKGNDLKILRRYKIKIKALID